MSDIHNFQARALSISSLQLLVSASHVFLLFGECAVPLILRDMVWFVDGIWMLATCILVLPFHHHCLIVGFHGFQLVTVDQKFEREKCKLPVKPTFPLPERLQ